MKVGFVQLKPLFGKKEKNLKNALRMLSRTHADLMVLPELFDTGYAFTSRKEALELSSEIDRSEAIAKLKIFSRNRRTVIIAGIAEREGKYVFNSSAAIFPSGKIEVYRKIHLFYKEKNIFEPGNTPLKVINYGKARIGMMICFDWIFPETARTLSLKGANIICHPSNLVLPHCQNAMITRCLENRIFIITCNRVGKEQRNGNSYNFTGISRVISPDGAILAEGGKVKEQVEVVDINLKRAENKKITIQNDLFKDRRREFYLI